MENFPSNSKHPARQKEEPRKVERVVSGEVARRKMPLGKRLTQNLIGGDTQGVWGYMFGEVLIPAARDMIVDAVSGGVERMFFGESSGPRRGGRSRSRGGYTDYSNVSRSRPAYRDEPRREISHRGRSTHNFDEIVLNQRVEAEEVLDRMDHMIDKYDYVSVSDFYEMCGITPNYTDKKWGWYDLHGAGVSRTRGGKYVINLTPPEPLD